MLVDYLFHPVGQGLMASGHISYIAQHSKRLSGKPVPVFSWIYDCGSISSRKLIQDGLSLVAAKVGGERPALDLVVISHFDKDHISGLTTLLTNYTVHTLVIPFVPLWQRLAIIFAKDRYIEKAAMPFYLDPVTAISRIKGSKITRIVIVPPSSGDGPPPATTDDRGPAPDISSRDPEQEKPQNNDQVQLTMSHGAIEFTDEVNTHRFEQGDPVVYMLPAGGSLTLQGHFEFVPYNDARLLGPADAGFIAAAKAKSTALLSPSTEAERKSALNDLKRYYHTRFKSPKERNEISLYMYAGPIFGSSLLCKCYYGSSLSEGHPSTSLRWMTPCVFPSKKASMLYTGDGYIDKADKWDRLASYLGPSRTTSLLGFQVMHHGALGNWHTNLAAKVDAKFAVFSSDPGHKRFCHPHKCVEQDFKSNSETIQVNRQTGCIITSIQC